MSYRITLWISPPPKEVDPPTVSYLVYYEDDALIKDVCSGQRRASTKDEALREALVAVADGILGKEAQYA